MSQKTFICRFCLTSKGGSVNVFDHCITTGISVHSWVKVAFGLQISKHDGLTQNICLTCLLKVYQTYFFEKKCQESENVLISAYGVNPIRSQGIGNSSKNDGNFLPSCDQFRLSLDDQNSRRESSMCADNSFSLSEDGQAVPVERKGVSQNHAVKPPNTFISGKRVFSQPESRSLELSNSENCFGNGQNELFRIKVKPLSDMMNDPHDCSTSKDMGNVTEREHVSQNEITCPKPVEITDMHVQNVIARYKFEKRKMYQSSKSSSHHDLSKQSLNLVIMDSNENGPRRKHIPEEEVLLKKKIPECEPGIPTPSAPETNVLKASTEENLSTNSINFSFVEKYASLKKSSKFSDNVTSTDPKLSDETKIAPNKLSDYYLEFVKFLDGNISDQNSLVHMFRKVHDMNLKEQSILKLGTIKPIDILQAFQSAENQCEGETTFTNFETCEEPMVDSNCDGEVIRYPYSKKGEVGRVPADLPVPKDFKSLQFSTKVAGHPSSEGLAESNTQPHCKIVDQGGSVNQTDDVNASKNAIGICFGKILTHTDGKHPLFSNGNESVSVENGGESSTKLKTITHKIRDPVTDKEQGNLNLFSKKGVGDMNSPNCSFWSCPKILPKSQSSTKGDRFTLSENIFSPNSQSCGEPNGAINSVKPGSFTGAQAASNLSSREVSIQPERQSVDSVSRELFPVEKESAHVEIHSSQLFPTGPINSLPSTKGAGLSEDGFKKNIQLSRKPNGTNCPMNNSINISDNQPTSTVEWNDTPALYPPPLMVKEIQPLSRRKTSLKSECSTKETQYILIDLEPDDSNQSSACEDLNKSLSTDNCVKRRKMAASGDCDEILDKSLEESCPQSAPKANGTVCGKKRKQKWNANQQEKCGMPGKSKPESKPSHDSFKSEVMCTSSDSGKSLSNSKRCDVDSKTKVMVYGVERKKKGAVKICEINGKAVLGNVGMDLRDIDNKTCTTDNKIKNTRGNAERDGKEGKDLHAKTPNRNSAANNTQKQCGISSRKRPLSPPGDVTKFQNKKSNPNAKFPSPIKDCNTPNKGTLLDCFYCSLSFFDSAELVEHVLHCGSNHSNGSYGTPQFASISKETKNISRINSISPEVGKNTLHSMRHMVVDNESPVTLVGISEAKNVSSETSSISAKIFEVDSARSSTVQSDSVYIENGLIGGHLSMSERAKCDSLSNRGQITEKNDQGTLLNNEEDLISTPKPVKTSEVHDERKPFWRQRFFPEVNVNETVSSSSEPPRVNDRTNLKYQNTKEYIRKYISVNIYSQPITNNALENGGSGGMLIPSPNPSKPCESSVKKNEKPCVGINSNKIDPNTKDVGHLQKNGGQGSTNSKKMNVIVATDASSKAKRKGRNKKKSQKRKLKKALSKGNFLIPCLHCPLKFPTHDLLLKHLLTHNKIAVQNIQVPPLIDFTSDTVDEPLLFQTFHCSDGPIEAVDKHIMGAMSDEKVDELRKIIRQQLGVAAYALINSASKKFRCPVCLNFFLKLCDVTSHIVRKHRELANEWPMSLLFSPDILKKINVEPVIDVSPAQSILPQTSQEPSLLPNSIKCERCHCKFLCKSALLKHSIWAHPPAVNNPC